MNSIQIISEIEKGNLILESLGYFLQQNLKKSNVEINNYYDDTLDAKIKTIKDDLIILNFEKCVVKTLEILQKVKEYHTQSKVLIINNHKLDIDTVKEFKNYTNLILFSTSSTCEELVKLTNNFDDQKMILCKNNQASLLDNLLNEKSNKLSSKFSQVESNIVDCADKGYSIIETAEKLQISSNTVAAYRSRILKKLGASSMLQAITMMRNSSHAEFGYR